MSAMNGQEETKVCRNCKRDILVPNFVIHELHCQRFIYVCDKCYEPVNRNERDAHDNENHVLVVCPKCKLQMEKFLMEVHEEQRCPYRKVKCTFCEIDITAIDIPEHENYCGSRTEKCPGCGEYVMIKYKQLHLDSNHTLVKSGEASRPSPSWQNGRRTLGNFIPELEQPPSKSPQAPKKKSAKSETKVRKAKGTAESTEKDGAAKESGQEANKDGRAPSEKSDETKGSAPQRKTKKSSVKKSSSSAASSQSADGSQASSGSSKDTKTRTKKGKKTQTKMDEARPETIPGESTTTSTTTTSTTATTTTTATATTAAATATTAAAAAVAADHPPFPEEFDKEEIFSRAIDENADALSRFTLSETYERMRNMTRTPMPGIHRDLQQTMRTRLFGLSDSSDEDLMMYSREGDDMDFEGLPCQFCDCLYPPYTLMSHQQTCVLNRSMYPRKPYRSTFAEDETEGGITCTICSQIVPYSRITYHQTLHDMAAKN